MKLSLSAHDIRRLMEYETLDVELDAEIFNGIGLKEAIEKVLQDETTAHAGTLYQEIRKQVDDYMTKNLPTHVGNYVRTQAHTARHIINKTVRKEVEEGIEAGIRHFAKTKTTQLADLIAAEEQPETQKLQEAILCLLDNVPDPVTPNRD